MADISALGNLQPVDVLDLTDGVYVDAKESSFRLPPAGTYTLRAPDSFPPASFSRTKAGALSVQIDPTIVGGEYEGFQIRYVKVSGKTFQRDGKTASQIGDYLRACGVTGTLKNEQEQADAVEATAGKAYQAKLDWRAYNTKTGLQVEGMARFPKNTDGTHQSWIEDKGDIDSETGKGKRCLANLTIPFNGYIAQ